MSSSDRPSLEIVGSLPSVEALEAAVDGLTSAGWDRSELSVLAQRNLIGGEPVAGASRDAADRLDTDTQGVISEPDVRQGRTLAAGMAGVVAAFVASGATILSGGAALAAVVGAAVAGGGAVALVEGAAGAVDHHRANFLRDQVRHGGILLWIKLRGPADEAKARGILTRHGATHIDVHELGDPAASGAARS